MKPIQIRIGDLLVSAVLSESATAEGVYGSLPVTMPFNTWGDEIYFRLPIDLTPRTTVTHLKKGDIAYWPDGAAFCIFFGPTPISQGDDIRPASPVCLIGRIRGDPEVFRKVMRAPMITVEPTPD